MIHEEVAKTEGQIFNYSQVHGLILCRGSWALSDLALCIGVSISHSPKVKSIVHIDLYVLTEWCIKSLHRLCHVNIESYEGFWPISIPTNAIFLFISV